MMSVSHMPRDKQGRSLARMEMGEEEEFSRRCIIFTDGQPWKEMRNAWMPWFTQPNIERFAGLMLHSADKFALRLGAAADAGMPIEIWAELGRMTLDVVGTVAFGIDLGTLSDEDLAPSGSASPAKRVSTPPHQLQQSLRSVFADFGSASAWQGVAIVLPCIGGTVRYLANKFPDAARRRYLAARRTLREVGRQLVADFRAQGAGMGSPPASPLTPTAPSDHSSAFSRTSERAGAGDAGELEPAAQPQGGPSEAGDGSWGIDPGSFLAVLTRAVDRAGGKHDDMWLVAQAFVFLMAGEARGAAGWCWLAVREANLLAGYETTANALAFCIALLAQSPDKEARLAEEIEAFGRAHAPGATDLDRFPYAKACFLESLRLYPPAPLTSRAMAEDVVTPEGLRIPRGTSIHINFWGIQRSTRYFVQPEAFIPERFLPGTPEAATSMLDAFMPFGLGARRCIGYRFATQEAVLTLVRLYSDLSFRLAPGQQVPLHVKTTGLTIAPVGGIHVTVHRRRRN
eukprot:scaffold4.g4737.t1